MRTARIGTTLAALAAGAALILGGAGVGQAAPAAQQAHQQVAAAQPAATAVNVPITGTFTDALGGVGTFAGTFTLNRVVNQNGQLAAVGTLTGTLTNSVGAVVGTVNQAVTVPLQVTGTCEILRLVLGPLHLDLLGLVVDLNQVVLVITAEQGPGNLLGNLLCAIAGLLDNTGSGALNGIVALLNRILAILG